MRTSAKRRARPGSRGLTLIEITIGLAVAALVTGVAVASINALTDAELRSASVQLTGAIKFTYDRAIMEKRVQRIGLDLDKHVWWIEYTEDPYALGRERLRGKEGESLEVEDRPERRRSRWNDEDLEVKRAMEGGRAAQFVTDAEVGKPRSLPDNVAFSKVWTGHQEEPFLSGVTYLHFFRGGWTEAAQIELTDGEEYRTLVVQPLTGRVRTYARRLEDPRADEDDGRHEGDE